MTAPTNLAPGACEVCGKPAVIVLARRLETYMPGTTAPDPSAELHPRCPHCPGNDAWTIDGMSPPKGHGRAKL